MTKPLIATTGVIQDTTNGGKGYQRTDKGELFVAAIGSMGDKDAGISDRVRTLVGKVALDDPSWLLRFDRWLRDEANMRSTTIAIACAFVHSRLEAGVVDETGPGPVPGLNRTAINVACLRADEPAKVIEYWRATYGPRLPMPVKRGVADAVVRLYDEWTALKYDNVSDALRLGDVIELVHPRAKDPQQGYLFEYLINRRHGWKRSDYLFPHLPLISASERLRSEGDRAALRAKLLADPALLKEAGWTWENLSTLGPMDAEAWQAVIPTMGYMALLRNLRNFDQAGIHSGSRNLVGGRLTNRREVEKSRLFPFRFLSAYLNASSSWHSVLDQALEHSLHNVPALTGDTLILVDCSISMNAKASAKSVMSRKQMAALFGVALAARCERSTLVRFGEGSQVVDQLPGVLATVQNRFPSMGGTQTTRTVKEWLDRDPTVDRVVVLTDEQANSTSGQQGTRLSVSDVVPDDVMLYTWNLGGKATAQAEATPSKHSFGGMTDQCFRLIPLIESGVTSEWPF